MVTVRKLIAELKKMPQNLPVGVAMQDNMETEVVGWVGYPIVTTDDYDPVNKVKCVVLRC